MARGVAGSLSSDRARSMTRLLSHQPSVVSTCRIAVINMSFACEAQLCSPFFLSESELMLSNTSRNNRIMWDRFRLRA
jgi:hypothetical protein